jgi:hypothetical protein
MKKTSVVFNLARTDARASRDASASSTSSTSAVATPTGVSTGASSGSSASSFANDGSAYTSGTAIAVAASVDTEYVPPVTPLALDVANTFAGANGYSAYAGANAGSYSDATLTDASTSAASSSYVDTYSFFGYGNADAEAIGVAVSGGEN